jgi:hypothetical protein
MLNTMAGLGQSCTAGEKSNGLEDSHFGGRAVALSETWICVYRLKFSLLWRWLGIAVVTNSGESAY